MSGYMKLLNISKTAAIIHAAIAGLFAVFAVAGLLIIAFAYPFERPLPYLLGLLLGCALSAVKVVLMEKSIGKSLDMEGKSAKNYAGLMVTLRYLLTFAVLAAVFLLKGVFGVFGVVLGLLSLQLAGYIAGYVLRGDNAL